MSSSTFDCSALDLLGLSAGVVVAKVFAGVPVWITMNLAFLVYLLYCVMNQEDGE